MNMSHLHLRAVQVLETEWQHAGAHARLAIQDLTHTQIPKVSHIL